MDSREDSGKLTNEDREPQVTQALASLPRVEAPHGFEARVMSRVREAGSRQGAWRLYLRPVSAVAAVALLLGVAGVLWMGRGDQSELARKVPPVVEAPESAPPVGDFRRGADSPASPAANGRVPAGSSGDGLTVVEKGAEAGKTVPAPGVDAGGGQPPAPVTVRASDYFPSIGAPVAVEGDGIKVLSVAAGSAAARCGLLAGDKVVVMDGIQLKGDTVLPAGFRGSVLQVRRPGEDKLLLLTVR